MLWVNIALYQGMTIIIIIAVEIAHNVLFDINYFCITREAQTYVVIVFCPFNEENNIIFGYLDYFE
jgi:hypothetical protein